MARAELYDAGEISGPDTRVQFVLDERPDVLGLPRCETALTRALCGSIPYQVSALDSQQCRGALDAAFCRAKVGVQRDGCGSQEDSPAGRCNRQMLISTLDCSI